MATSSMAQAVVPQQPRDLTRHNTDRQEAATPPPHGLGGIRIILRSSGNSKVGFTLSNLLHFVTYFLCVLAVPVCVGR